MLSDLDLQLGVDAAAMLELELDLLQSIARVEPAQFKLLVWESTPALVISTKDARLPNTAAAARQLESSDWRMVTRKTGGSAFPQGPGIINISLVFNAGPSTQSNSIDADYELFCSLCQRTLSRLGIATETGSVAGSFCDGRYNITAGGLKLAGTSQRWSRRDGVTAKLFHCGLLFDVDCKELCKQVNFFYQLAQDQHEPEIEPVLAEKHTCVRALSSSASRQLLLSALQESVGEFRASINGK